MLVNFGYKVRCRNNFKYVRYYNMCKQIKFLKDRLLDGYKNKIQLYVVDKGYYKNKINQRG